MITDITAIVSSIAAVIALFFVSRQLHIQSRRRQLELGMLYVQRYWVIEDGLLQAGDDPEVRIMHQNRYLRLADDEFDAFSNGWINDAMWRVWHDALTSSRGRGILRRYLEDVQDKDAYANVRHCLGQRPGHEWTECVTPVRKSRHRRRLP